MRLLAAEGALRENIFDNEESSGGAGGFSRRGTKARGTALAGSLLNYTCFSKKTFLIQRFLTRLWKLSKDSCREHSLKYNSHSWSSKDSVTF